jgi:phosphoribosylformylglycinamidine synthase
VTLAGEPSPEAIRDAQIYRALGLTDAEYQRAVRMLGRLPNYTETGLFSVMWSEHCSYKNSKSLLRQLPTSGPRVLMGPGEGAGVVDIGDGQAVVFKIESHNHPSAVAPFHGASTGVGGIVRDIYSIGARPIALLNSLRFGRLDSAHVRHLFKEVVRGIADYGRRLDVPTAGGEVAFASTYEGNPLVNAMGVGLVAHDKVQRGIAKGAGNLVLYLGRPTGRDGIHGATFASEELNEDTEATFVTGDPEFGKRLMEACLEIVEKGLLVGIQDMGAAGLTCSSSEMAAKGGHGVELDLDQVPLAESGMTPYEMMLSETQERMLQVIRPEDLEQVQDICRRWQVPAVVIGRVTEDQQLRLLYQGQVVTEVPVKALTDAPVYEPKAEKPEWVAKYEAWDAVTAVRRLWQKVKAARLDHAKGARQTVGGFEPVLKKLLSWPNVASKAWAYRQFSSDADRRLAVLPGSDAGVMRLPGTEKHLAVTTDGNAHYVYLNPRMGGAIAVAEAARNLVCSGAEPLAVTDGLNYGSPEKPHIYWQLRESLAGIGEACRVLETPVISGNVSLYNETRGEAIFPTPIIGMVGLIEKPERITTIAFKNEGDRLLLLGETRAEVGGSQYQEMLLGSIEGPVPVLDLEAEKRLQACLRTAIREGWVASAHDLSEGGLAAALCESAIAGGKGAVVEIQPGEWEGQLVVEQLAEESADPAEREALRQLEAELYFFSESQSRVLVSAGPEGAEAIQALAREQGVPCVEIGRVAGSGDEAPLIIQYRGQIVAVQPLGALKQAWQEAIPWLMEAE